MDGKAEKKFPNIAPTIEVMKEEVEDDWPMD